MSAGPEGKAEADAEDTERSAERDAGAIPDEGLAFVSANLPLTLSENPIEASRDSVTIIDKFLNIIKHSSE